MKTVKIVVLFFVLSVALIIVSKPEAQAECIRKAVGSVWFYITYLDKTNNYQRKDKLKLGYFEVDGRYGGNCNIRGKKMAKKRAIEKFKQMINGKYYANQREQLSALCTSLAGGSSRAIQIREKYEWIQLDYIKFFVYIPNDLKYDENVRIPSAFRGKITCNGNNFEYYNPPPPPTVTNPAPAASSGNTSSPPSSGSPPPPTATSAANRIEYNTDRKGSDYKNFWMSPELPSQVCRKACEDDPGCRAWTYVKSGVQGKNARCWLKNRVPPKSMNTNCISGVK